jgi:hypothetical protein
MKRYVRVLGIIVLLAGGSAGWALFRPSGSGSTPAVNESFRRAASPWPPVSPRADRWPSWPGSFHRRGSQEQGTAAVHRLADGRRILRFTNFETSNGPDVRVYLVAAADASDSATVTGPGSSSSAS